MFNKEKIIQILEERKCSFIELAKELEVPRFKNREFSTFLFEMVKSKEIFKNRKEIFYLPKLMGDFEGIISINSKGFGFVDFKQENNNLGQSIFISKFDLNGAFNGDKVAVKVFCEIEKEKRCFGHIIKIIKRNTKFLVGWSIKIDNKIKFKAFNEKYNVTNFLFINNDEDIKEDTLLKVEIIEFHKSHALVKIIKKIGILNNSFDEIDLIIENANIINKFSEETLEEAKKIPQSIDDEKDEISQREDCRDKLVVTIDGEDTKDFDDAISVEKKDKNYLLSVYIADVSYYIKENSAIDIEALTRGTSIYLVDRVIPMLPKSLSNGICSLNPNVDRFTMAIEMEIDQYGNTIKSEIFPSIINSKKRLTYNEVNKFYNNEIKLDDVENLENMLNNALELSKILQKFKENEGYVDFEIEESKITLDEKGKVKDISIKERGVSEILIENFMIRANETVAEMLAKNKVPTLYRIHEKPDSEKITKLNDVTKTLALNVKFQNEKDPLKFSKSLFKLKQERFDNFIKIMILRTMQKAKYSPLNIGHFGLGSKYYLHFTSPIRRYPDLLTHRIIREIIFNNRKDKIAYFNKNLRKIGEKNSESENKAVELERNVTDIKKAEFFENKIGKEFNGIIASILSFGFFVEFDNKVDVLVHKNNLMDDYVLNENGTKFSYKNNNFLVGDKVDVKIIGTNKLLGKIDAVLANDYNHWKNNNNK